MTVMEKLSPIDVMKWGPGPYVLSNRNEAINKTKILFWTIYIYLLLENYSPRTSSPRSTCGVKSAHRRDLTAGYSLQTEQLKAVGSGIFIRNNTKTCFCLSAGDRIIQDLSFWPWERFAIIFFELFLKKNKVQSYFWAWPNGAMAGNEGLAWDPPT